MDKSGHIAGMLFSTIFGFSFMFSKIALENLSPMALIAYRFLLAFLVFEVLRLFKVVNIRFQKNLILPIFLVALFQPVLYFIFETYGLNLISSSEAGMMIALIPIVVTILSTIILKEKPNRYQVMFILISVAGILLIQIFKSNLSFDSSLLGFFLLFMAVMSAALFNIASRNASKKVKAFELTYFMMMAGAVSYNLIYLVQLAVNNSLSDYYLNLLNMRSLISILYLGIGASIIAFFLVNFTLGKLPAHVSSIYANLSTIVAVIAGAVFLKEALYWYHIVGGILIVVGVYGTVRMNLLNTVPKEDIHDQYR